MLYLNAMCQDLIRQAHGKYIQPTMTTITKNSNSKQRVANKTHSEGLEDLPLQAAIMLTSHTSKH